MENSKWNIARGLTVAAGAGGTAEGGAAGAFIRSTVLIMLLIDVPSPGTGEGGDADLRFWGSVVNVEGDVNFSGGEGGDALSEAGSSGNGGTLQAYATVP